jgi:hypothetical protein
MGMVETAEMTSRLCVCVCVDHVSPMPMSSMAVFATHDGRWLGRAPLIPLFCFGGESGGDIDLFKAVFIYVDANTESENIK